MTPQSVDSVGTERRLVEEFYNLPVHVNPGLILAPLLNHSLRTLQGDSRFRHPIRSLGLGRSSRSTPLEENEEKLRPFVCEMASQNENAQPVRTAGRQTKL